MTVVFNIGTVRANPGVLSTGYIESAYLRDGSRVRIPLIVVNGTKAGPVLWVGSTSHGDEIPGCEVITERDAEHVRRRTRLRAAVRVVRWSIFANWRTRRPRLKPRKTKSWLRR